MYSELPLTTTATPNVSVDCTSDDARKRPQSQWLNSPLPLVAGKKLERGISRANENAGIVSRARNEMAMDIRGNFLVDVDSLNSGGANYTFTIPDLTVYSEEFRWVSQDLSIPSPFNSLSSFFHPSRKFIEKDLIENSTLLALESSHRLNWWASAFICQKLWPLSTTGDGNCLLHAASLAMWGFHDRKLTLRAALYSLLAFGEFREPLWRRWRFQQTKLNKQAGFVYSEGEWKKEWGEIVAMASPEPRQSSDSGVATRRRSCVVDPRSAEKDNVTYESLEEIHILALAHVLRRPIIVVSDTMLRDMNGEAMAPITFGGIYLPFEVPSEECHRSPLLLTYDTAHFSALVPMDSASEFPPALIPLVDSENKLLPVQFCIDPGQSFDWTTYDGSGDVWSLSDTEHVSLLREYLDVTYALNPSSPDDEIYEDYWTDEESEAKRQFGDAEVVLSDDTESEGSRVGCAGESATKNGNNRKASKQLQNVAKQFGSIGKNMSKKIKKNFGSITSNFKHHGHSGSGKKSAGAQRSSSFSKFSKVLCAELKNRRHGYQQEMITNYLECAHLRFRELHGADTQIRREEAPSVPTADAALQPQTVALTNTPTTLMDSIASCINSGCQNFGTSSTSYLCEECFERQKRQEESHFQDPPRYGTGNSKFYAQADLATHRQIQNLPPARRLQERDQTLYLSNSTFYNDRLAGSGVPVAQPTATAGKVINHRILVEGQDYNRPLMMEQGVRPVPPPRRESQRNAIYFGEANGHASPEPCKTAGCTFFGTGTQIYCSKCRQSFPQPAKILTDV